MTSYLTVTSCQVVTSYQIVTSCQVATTFAAILPSDKMAQGNRGALRGASRATPIQGCDFHTHDRQSCHWTTLPRVTDGLPPFEAATFTRLAMLPLNDMAPSDRGERLEGLPLIRGCDFHPICNVALAIRVGPKGPKCWPQASAGDYKGFLAEISISAISPISAISAISDLVDLPISGFCTSGSRPFSDGVPKSVW